MYISGALITRLQNFKQLLNSEITDITNRIWHLNGKLGSDITDWFYTEIESMFQFSNNQIQNQNNQTISQQFHKFNFNIYPKENQYLGLKTEFVKTNLFSESNENFFAELVYRYTWKKKDIDFELQLNNIFNTNMYRTVSINDFIYVESNFNIRPRQLIFKIRMSI